MLPLIEKGLPWGERMRSAPILNTDKTPEFDGAVEATQAPAGIVRRVGAFLLRELREMLPPSLFFFIGFNLIVLTTNLLLADYGEAVAGFLLACGRKSGVGGQRHAVDPSFRSCATNAADLVQVGFYWGVVFVARLLEHWIRFWLVEHHPLGTFLPHMVATFDWHRFIASSLGHQPASRAAAKPAAADP
jgi:hypothetical protein